MLNLNVSVQVKGEIATIRDNVLDKEALNLSAYDVNKIINAYQDKWDAVTADHFKDLSFKELVEDMAYYEKGYNLLLSLKLNTCSRSGDTYRKYQDAMRHHKNWKVFSKISEMDKLSLPERIVLANTVDCNFDTNPDLNSLYNPITDKDGSDKFMAEIEAFDYGDYGVVKDLALENLRKELETHKRQVEAYKAIRNEAGNDILIWSDQKITLRLKSKGFLSESQGVTRWMIQGWVKVYSDHLKEQGVEVNMQKQPKVKRVEAKFLTEEAKSTLTQDELFSVFKQGTTYNAEKSVSLMDLSTIHKVMDSTLTCVRHRLDDSHITNKRHHHTVTQVGPSQTSTARKLIERAMELGTTQAEHDKLMAFVGGFGYWCTLSWPYFVRMFEGGIKVSTSEIVSFGKVMTLGYPSINERFFDGVVSKLSLSERYLINNPISGEFVSRLDNEGKIGFLKELSGEKLIHFDYGMLEKIYLSLDYAKVRPHMLAKDTILRNMGEVILLNKDQDAAFRLLCIGGVEYNEAVKLFGLLPFERRVGVIQHNLNESEWSTDRYATAVSSVFTVGELPLLLEKLLLEKKNTQGIQEYITAVFKAGGLSTDLCDVVCNSEYTQSIPLHGDVVSCLDNRTKKHLIKTGRLQGVSDQQWEGDSRRIRFDLLFGSLSRSDLEEVVDNFLCSKYRKYMAHAMTASERVEIADSDMVFQRYNMEILGYGYFRKFEKDKVALKGILGDLRNTSNKVFADKLRAMYESVNASVRFMLELTDETDQAS